MYVKHNKITRCGVPDLQSKMTPLIEFPSLKTLIFLSGLMTVLDKPNNLLHTGNNHALFYKVLLQA